MFKIGIKYFVFFLLVFMGKSLSQTINNRIFQIELKLRSDLDYLNVKYINVDFSDSKFKGANDFPRTIKENFSFSFTEGVSYKILFLNEGLGIDSIYILKVQEIIEPFAQVEAMIGKDRSKIDTIDVLNFNEIWELKNKYFSKYQEIRNIVRNYILQNGAESIGSTMSINHSRGERTVLGISTRDRTDFLDLEGAESYHWFPREREKITSNVSSRLSKTTDTPLKFSISLSKLTFSYSSFMQFHKVSGASLEANTEEDLINIVPYQSNALNMLTRILLVTKEKDVKNSLFIDISLGYRLNSSAEIIQKLADKLKIVKSKIYLSNAFILKFNITRPFDLPYFSLEAVLGKNESYSEVYPDFYSNNQIKAFFTFYWDASDQLNNRFKINVGIGYHDIWNRYKNTIGQYNRKLIFHKIQPYLGFEYLLFNDDQALLNLGLSIYNLRVKPQIWINFLRFETSTFRLSAEYITEPIFRKYYSWEIKDSYFFNLGWRYGLN